MSAKLEPTQRRWLAVAVAIAIALAAGTLWQISKGRANLVDPVSMGSTSAASSAALPASTVSLFEIALTAADPVTIERALAPEVRVAYDQRPFPLLPTGSTAVIDSQTMTVTGEEATVAVTVSGSQPGQWQLLLISVDGQWLIYGTVRT